MLTGNKHQIKIDMKYINEYATTAAYTADSNRPTTASTVSNIEDGTGLKFDGKNVLSLSPGIGDIVVFDKTTSTKKFIKLDTYYAATLSPNLVVMGVVYDRTEKEVLVVAKNEIASQQWAAPYRVKLTGFDLATGGSFTITVNATTTAAITYAASATLAQIASSIMAALEAAGFTAATGWTATADTVNNCIVVQQSWYAPNVTIFTVTDASSKVVRTILTGNYQTAVSGLLPTYGSISRKDGSAMYFAGAIWQRFYDFFRVSGDDTTNNAVGATSVIRESRFNATDNPLLTAFYSNYIAYLQDKMLKYPSSKNAITSIDGKGNTAKLAAVTYVDADGTTKKAYPAAASAAAYGIAVAGATTGFEAGGWWLPSSKELYTLVKDVTYGLAGITTSNCDAVNRSLSAIGGNLMSVGSYWWSSTECSANSAWSSSGSDGILTYSGKDYMLATRPVSAFLI